MIKSLALQLTLTSTITYAIFPGTLLSSKLHFLQESSSSQAWSNLLMILIFSLGDTSARIMACFYELFNKDNLIYLTCFRLIFVGKKKIIKLTL